MTDVQQTEPELDADAVTAGADDSANVEEPTEGEHTEGEHAAPTSAELDAEGDIAADYIEELLDICDIDGDIDIDARNGRAYVSVNAEDAASLHLLSKPDTQRWITL